MIPKIPIQVESSWQKELGFAFKDAVSLLQYLKIDPQLFAQADKARQLFPMLVPLSFANKMEKGNRNDPLLLQVLPQFEEFSDAIGYSHDPLGEQNNAIAGMLHKYESRVLLILKSACAVNCRYCFRRHFPYSDNQLKREDWLQVVDHIAQDERINEVILSGGDPLMASTDFLTWLMKKIEAVPHITRIRIHSRLPVVLPARLDAKLIDWFSNLTRPTVLVLHINHPNEVDEDLCARLLQLKACGITLLNQAVLLRGVNNNADTLCALSERLFSAGVLPYYLFQLDKVKGAHHFEVSDDEARKLLAQMIKRLPGFLVPKLAREIENQPGKTPIDLHLHP